MLMYIIYTYRIQVDEGSDNGDDDNNNTSRTNNTTTTNNPNPSRTNTNNVPRSALLKKSHPDRGLRVSTGAGSSSSTGAGGEKGLGTARSLAPHDSYIFTNSGK